MNFNPILSRRDFEQMQREDMPKDIAAEQKHITWADALIFFYPVWWINMSAILKGYIDRTFTYGFAYHMTENGPEGLLKGKKAVVISTAAHEFFCEVPFVTYEDRKDMLLIVKELVNKV